MEMLILDDFYVSVAVNDDGSKKTIIGDYGSIPNMSANKSSGLFVSLTSGFEKFKEHFHEIEKFLLNNDLRNGNIKQGEEKIQKKDQKENHNRGQKEEEDRKEEEQDRKKKKRKVDLKNKAGKPKKPVMKSGKRLRELKVKLPVRRRLICDEVERNERQKRIEEMLFKIYAGEVEKVLADKVKEECFGCKFDRPS